KEVGERISGRDILKLEIPPRKLIAHLVEHVIPERAADFERMPPANPRQVVAELERTVPVGVRSFRVVAKTTEAGDADRWNAPRLGRIQRDARDGQLLDDVARERQLTSE